MNVLDLFSGIGGFSLGLERAGMKTAAFCEIEKFPQAVLRKHWPDVPIYDDIRTLTAERLEQDGIGTIDVICGGFPCQPFSSAGRRAGKEDNRDLWPEMFRIIQECQPTWVIGENVANFVNMEFERTAVNLEDEGYEVQPIIIPACGVGLPHKRDRVWIIAYSSRNGRRIQQEQSSECEDTAWVEKPSQQRVAAHPDSLRQSQQEGNEQEFGGWLSDDNKSVVSDSDGKRKQIPITRGFAAEQMSGGDGEERASSHSNHSIEGGLRSGKKKINPLSGFAAWWETEPTIRRIHDGIPKRLDPSGPWRTKRLKALGNAVVPQIPEIIGRAIMEHAA